MGVSVRSTSHLPLLPTVLTTHRSEILPLRLRQRGSSISTASNWIINYMIVQITPPAIKNIGWRTYIIFAVLNAVFVPIIYVFFPETKGLELEAVDRLFSGDDEPTEEMEGKGDQVEVIHKE
jgi:hypothetical protein